jgi:hypothetical protein
MTARLPHPLFGFDYTSEIPTSTLKSMGVQFVVRYLSRYTPKVITRGEYERLTAAGIGVALVFEDSATNAELGHGQGLADAQFALAQAIDICGHPAVERPITAAVDYDPAGAAARTDPYFDAWAQVRGSRALAGPYGGIEVIRHQADRGFDALFQTYAWSGGLIDGRAKILQYSNGHVAGGHGVDFNHAFFADYMQWNIARPDPYAIFKDEWFHFTIEGRRIRVNELHEVKTADALLREPRPPLPLLVGERMKLKELRDRLKRVACVLDPLPDGHANWTPDDRGKRWQGLNRRMNEISRRLPAR